MLYGLTIHTNFDGLNLCQMVKLISKSDLFIYQKSINQNTNY